MGGSYFIVQVKLIDYIMANEVGDRISRDRIITLVDAVLAIVMTLLVLEIAVPQLSQSEVATETSKTIIRVVVRYLELCNKFHNLGFFLDWS